MDRLPYATLGSKKGGKKLKRYRPACVQSTNGSADSDSRIRMGGKSSNSSVPKQNKGIMSKE